jgi:hypothetical protein
MGEYDANEMLLETEKELKKEARRSSATKKEGVSPSKVMYKQSHKLKQARNQAGVY